VRADELLAAGVDDAGKRLWGQGLRMGQGDHGGAVLCAAVLCAGWG
jgi:hypothetical protein